MAQFRATRRNSLTHHIRPLRYLLLLEIHLEIAFVNLGFARCSTFNSLLTGVGVDCVCAYLFILRWGLGCACLLYTSPSPRD